ncbi:MAG: flagellar biosynthesis protein FlhB [Alphaproteobacteria bacterium CG11_big_fil_rev_8_21_14_0_20_39_49]|nr:MAG: flagellar biosynthesis protein FlhB [Alphaproteobacteria bacterium CG11_big_fil_rev_8_21_14_0_20_39_49]
MPDEDQDNSQKTEDPTQKRLDDAFKKGQVPHSREVTSLLMLVVFALIMIWMAPSIMERATLNMTRFIGSAHDFHIDSQSITGISTQVLKSVLFLMIVPVSILILIIYVSSMIQHPIVFSHESFMPKLERISLLKGLKRLFSMRSIMEFLKGIFKITLVAVVGYIVVYPSLNEIINVQNESIMATMLLLLQLATKMMIGVCAFMSVIAVIDFLYQKYEHIKSLKMSKRDLKDEFKQTEGSPEVKAKLREIRNKRAQNRMMQNVPDADVVITNPTHYSIALKYDEAVNQAPVVVAKGMDFIALKIKEVAKENNVPIIENAPLARALYASVELEQEVPFKHYEAVAEVIRYIYKLKGKNNKKSA